MSSGTSDEFGVAGSGTTTLNYSCYANATGDIYIAAPAVFTATNNNITSDPQFVGSGSYPYAILGISPCADAGNNSYITESYDIRGSSYPRKLNKLTGAAGTVDMGAYEYKVGNDPLPVELTTFNAVSESNKVVLNWTTATERNNYGFEIERAEVDNNSYGSLPFFKIGFVQGHILSNSPKEYSFVDNTVSPGNKYSYRLKQIDNDGPTSYSKIIDVQTGVIPGGFILNQNFPNPFNPSTTIKFAFADNTKAELIIYDVLGNKIAELFNNNADAGRIYEVQFNASNLSSGVYCYKLTGVNKTGIKKMLILK